MTRSLRFAAVLSWTLLAAVAAQAAVPAGITTTGCEEQEFSLQYPSAPFKKLLPPGFKLNTLDPTGLLAAVDISVDHCNSVDGGAGSDDLTAFVEVVPPAEYQQPNLAAYGLLLAIWSTRAQTVDSFTAWGFGKQAAAGAIAFKNGLDLLGRKIGTVTVQAGASKISAITFFAAHKSTYPAGATRAFAQDATGALHILDASWTDQTFQPGIATFAQSGPAPLPLPLPLQIYPALAGHATNYALSLHSVQ